MIAHYPEGPWMDTIELFVGRCRCGERFEGETRADAEQAWRDHFATVQPVRDKVKAAVNRARHSWICSHGVKGQGIDDAITDTVLATL